MALAPVNQRSSSNLMKELQNLVDCKKKCAEIFGEPLNKNGETALERIQDAIDAIKSELSSRV